MLELAGRQVHGNTRGRDAGSLPGLEYLSVAGVRIGDKKLDFVLSLRGLRFLHLKWLAPWRPKELVQVLKSLAQETTLDESRDA